MRSLHKIIFAGMLTCAATAVSAQDTGAQICRLELMIEAIIEQPYPMIRAKIQSATPETKGAECPSVGDMLDFLPSTADYQSGLPRNEWPEQGQSVDWRYVYVDSICKGEDGGGALCRMEHYPQGSE